jgi:hypothetical protein
MAVTTNIRINYQTLLHLPDFLKIPHKSRFAKLLENGSNDCFMVGADNQCITL